MPDMEMQFPRPYDRVLWTGGADLMVTGIGQSFQEVYADGGTQARIPVFSVDGTEKAVGLDDRFEPALLVLKPVEVQFGDDPEKARAAAPKRISATISTKEEEFSAMVQRIPLMKLDEDTGGGAPPNYGGYVLSHSISTCLDIVGQVDSDQDGIRDACEYEVANAFRPGLRFSHGEVDSPREEYWAVRRSNSDPNALAVFYALGYYVDGGDLLTGTYAHDGDSEFLVLEISDYGGAWPSGHWAVETVTYSAHWHSTWDRTDKQDYTGTIFWTDGTYRGRPRSYVAHSKHGNYRSQSFCGSRFDDCDPIEADTAFLVDTGRNLGNYWAAGQRLLTNPCPGSIHANQYGQPNTTSECFWTDEIFRGWRSENGDGATPYKNSLEWYNF